MKPAMPPGTRPATRTFHVLAGAYTAKNPKSLLTHVAEVNERNYPIRVLCKRVDVDHDAGGSFRTARDARSELRSD